MANLYLDHGINRHITPVLQHAGHDVVTARSRGLQRAGDDEHLLVATRADRILVTHDQDFITLHNAWRRWSAEWGVSALHPGILIVAQPPVAPALYGAQELAAFLAMGHVLTNELYRWTPDRGWVHHPNP